MLDELREVAGDLVHERPRLAMVSTVTGALVTELTAAHWVDNARYPARFADAVRVLEDAGVSRFVELGPDAALTGLARASLADGDVLALGVLTPDQDEVGSVLLAAGLLHTDGLDLDVARLTAGRAAKRIALPPYAFHRTRYWPDEDTEALHAKSLTMSLPMPAQAPVLSTEDIPGFDPAALLAGLAGLPARQREKALVALVCEHAAAVLGYSDAAAIESDQQFLEVGFDSVAAVRLRTSLSEATGLRLPTTAIFDRRTPAALAAYLRTELERVGTEGPDPAAGGSCSSSRCTRDRYVTASRCSAPRPGSAPRSARPGTPARCRSRSGWPRDRPCHG
jgi:acyl transferase domain-containing protein